MMTNSKIPNTVLGPDMEKHRVLLVDDDEFVRQAFETQLTILGVDVDAASGGTEALEMFGKEKYHLILTDCRMPNMDGYELAKKIRSHERDRSLSPTPILAITGGAEGDWSEAGMNGTMSKPVELDELREALSTWLKEM